MMDRNEVAEHKTPEDAEKAYPDCFLPLHHRAVERATGVSAKTLRRALKSNPEQFASDAYQVILADGHELIRFNPARHLRSLKERMKWEEKSLDGQSTSEDAPFGSGGRMARAEKYADASSIRQASNSISVHQKTKSGKQPPISLKSGSEILTEKLKAMSQSKS
jgi:hypothetical protein